MKRIKILLIITFLLMIAIVGCKKEEKNSIDNSKLKKAIDTYGQYNNDDGKYSISSYKALMDSVDAGMKILEKASCTQEEIDNAEKNIKELAGKLKEDRWTEPLNDAEKNIVIQQCISDYEMLGMDDSDTISTKLSDWDIHIYPEKDNLIAARCNKLDEEGYKSVVAAFTVDESKDTVTAHFEWINYCYVKTDEREYENELIKIGYWGKNGLPK